MANQPRVRLRNSEEAEPSDSHPHTPVVMNVSDTRRLFYNLIKKGRTAREATEHINDLKQEVSMNTSSFPAGSAEYKEYFKLRRAGETRSSAFRKAGRKAGYDDPDKGMKAREIQEGRKETVLPGNRRVFHSSDEDAQGAKSGNMAERRQASIDRVSGRSPDPREEGKKSNKKTSDEEPKKKSGD